MPLTVQAAASQKVMYVTRMPARLCWPAMNATHSMYVPGQVTFLLPDSLFSGSAVWHNCSCNLLRDCLDSMALTQWLQKPLLLQEQAVELYKVLLPEFNMACNELYCCGKARDLIFVERHEP